MDLIMDRLRKIAALAESGIGGERENAQRMLEELCRKHHVTPEQLLGEEMSRYEFKYGSAEEKTLLIQCAGYICNIRQIAYGEYQGQKFIVLDLTRAQFIDLTSCYHHYQSAWRKQRRQSLEDLMTAFIHTHRIFAPPSDQEVEETAQDRARSMRIAGMMMGMDRRRWNGRRSLGEGAPELTGKS